MSRATKKQFLRNNEKNEFLEASKNKRFGENQPRDSCVEPTKKNVLTKKRENEVFEASVLGRGSQELVLWSRAKKKFYETTTK